MANPLDSLRSHRPARAPAGYGDGLDDANERAVMDALERASRGRATFLVTHDLATCGPPICRLRGEVDLRYEVNETDSPRQHYVRWTFGSAYSFLLPAANRFEVEVRYRMQRYPFRAVEVDDIDVQRRDHRWIPRVTWTRPLRPGVDLRVGYTRETRSSNDLDWEFSANLFSFGVVRRW